MLRDSPDEINDQLVGHGTVSNQVSIPVGDEPGADTRSASWIHGDLVDGFILFPSCKLIVDNGNDLDDSEGADVCLLEEVGRGTHYGTKQRGLQLASDTATIRTSPMFHPDDGREADPGDIISYCSYLSEEAVTDVEAENGITVADLKVETYDAIEDGKCHLPLSNIASVVKSLGQVCELFHSQIGETASKCYEVYFPYGKALLELARLESEVLRNAIDGVPHE